MTYSIDSDGTEHCTYTARLDPTGCETPDNPTRAEEGQPGEAAEYETLPEALEAFGALREGTIYDEWDDPLIYVRLSGRGLEAVAADGTWGPLDIREHETILAALEGE